MASTQGYRGRPGRFLQRWYAGQITVFRYPDFRFLMASTFFNSFAHWTEQVVLGWLVLGLTDSTFMVGLAYAARMVPFFFLGIPAGVVADGVNRRLFLRIMTAGIGATWFVIAALVMMEAVQAWHLILLALLGGCLRAFFSTTHSALVYDITGPRGAVMGMAWTSVIGHGSGMFGALMAGRIIAGFGNGAAYLAAGASFAISFALLLFMRESGQAAPRSRESIQENVQGAFRLLRTNQILLGLTVLTAGSEMFGYSSSVVLPTFARDVLHVGPEGLGLMVAIRAGAGILGPVFLSAVGESGSNGKMLLGSVVLFGIGIVALGFVPNLSLALVVLAVINAAGSALDVLTKTFMQAHVSNEERGRAMGAWVAGIGTGPVGQVEIGGVVAALGVATGLALNGGALLLTALAVFLAVPGLRRI